MENVYENHMWNTNERVSNNRAMVVLRFLKNKITFLILFSKLKYLIYLFNISVSRVYLHFRILKKSLMGFYMNL